MLTWSVHAEWRQVIVGERPTEIAAVTADDEGSGFGPDPDRLVASCVTVGEHAGHCVISQEVIIAADLDSVVAVGRLTVASTSVFASAIIP